MWDNHAFLLFVQLDAEIFDPQNSVDHLFPPVRTEGTVALPFASESRVLVGGVALQGGHFSLLSFDVPCGFSLSYRQGEGLKGRLVS